MENGEEQKEKRAKISQTDIPRLSLEKSLVVANALWNEFAGKSAQPHQIALALELSPQASTWRILSGASIAYGLTEGGYNSKEISLTPLGKSIVAPIEEGADSSAVGEAILRPRILKEFFTKYNNAKLPSKTIAINVLISMGLPKDRIEDYYEMIVENGKYAGIIIETKTGPFVTTSGSRPSNVRTQPLEETIIEEQEVCATESLESFAKKISGDSDTPEGISAKEQNKPRNNRVFISHGKNKEVVEQLKEIIKFGKYEPVVSVEKEATSIPVPDKVLDDMRSCFAGIINVHSEGQMLDTDGKEHIKINDNVLIEIGAAMALYGRNYILLVQKGIKMPSNLQGLYRCEYEGAKLDYDATMKLLKAFNEFGNND